MFKFKNYSLKKLIFIIKTYKLPPVLICIFGFIFKYSKLRDFVVIESFGNFDGNANEIFKKLINDERFRNYKFLWLTKDQFQIPQEYLQDKRIKYSNIYSISLTRLYMQSTAKLVLSENFFIHTYNKKQINIYLTHGFPIKNTIGTICVPEYVTYVCVASKKYAYIQENQFSYNEKKSIFVGYPRNDLFYANQNELKKVGLHKTNYEKVVIWMPTFRKLNNGRVDGEVNSTLGLPIISNETQYNQLNLFCEKNNILLFIKLHRSQDLSVVNIESKSNVYILKEKEIAEKKINLYGLIAQTDALISDYSSITLDYLLLNKPIGYTIDDINSYSRGFSVDNPKEFMVGDLIPDFNGLTTFLEMVCQNQDKHKQIREGLKNEFWDYYDGASANRLLDFIISKLFH